MKSDIYRITGIHIDKRSIFILDTLSNSDYYRHNRNHRKEGDMVLNIKDFPDELHRRAKIFAVTSGISLKELVIRAIIEYLEKYKD